MKIAFDSSLEHQQEAIASIVDLWKGNQEAQQFSTSANSSLFNATGNILSLSLEQIVKNLSEIQERNGIAPSFLEDMENLDFSVEMETGTGKTYVYLRTIYELYQNYGFKKFIIVVPSIAIREGVLKSLEITKEHFKRLYDNIPMSSFVYSRERLGALKNFAEIDQLQILVMNIDSFRKSENVINQENDRIGGKPIEYIQAVRPIVIIDEPQNMEAQKSQEALKSLNPLFTLRYSATHKAIRNLVYKLDPIQAYDAGLVKQITVFSVLEEDKNQAFISLEGFVSRSVEAKITIFSQQELGVRKKPFKVGQGVDLFKLSGGLEVYQGYRINEMDMGSKYIAFSNGLKIHQGEKQGGNPEDVWKVQIKQTIIQHLQKEKDLKGKGIKVLSLFFLDRVADYRIYPDGSSPEKGKVAQWFEESYQELIQETEYQELEHFPVDQVHNGYFSADKKGFKDTKGDSKSDEDTFNLIMRDKEALLDLKNPLKFIFSHSALKEGWDNPNVFQICTLNHSQSEMTKRQVIGRGLRLCVDQTGQRILDKDINRLTTIVNESYLEFASTLQTEMEEDCGVSFSGRVNNAKDGEVLKYRDGFEKDPAFRKLWQAISPKTTYQVCLDTQNLIHKLAKEIEEMPYISKPSIIYGKNQLIIKENGIEASEGGFLGAKEIERTYTLPNLLSILEERFPLTRSTFISILQQSNRLEDFKINPQVFLEKVLSIFKVILPFLQAEGIEYSKDSSSYGMEVFERESALIYPVEKIKVENKNRTIFDNFIPLDSKIEKDFAIKCNTAERVAFYLKMPDRFKIKTPIGNYNPDWALLVTKTENTEESWKIIVETKGTENENLLRPAEALKIRFARKHFEALESVKYEVSSDLKKTLERL